MLRRGWARYAVERFSLLRRWRELAGLVARACKSVLGGGCERVYVVGGAAEGRLTVFSDIDVVVVVGSPRLKGLEVAAAIRREAERLGLPLEAPVDLKLLTRDEFRRLVEEGVYRRVVEVS